jgi:hypothetical protein
MQNVVQSLRDQKSLHAERRQVLASAMRCAGMVPVTMLKQSAGLLAAGGPAAGVTGAGRRRGGRWQPDGRLAGGAAVRPAVPRSPLEPTQGM